MTTSAFAVFLSLGIAAAAQTSSPDPEGFIRNWLVLAPIAIEGESGADEIESVLEKDTDRVDVTLTKGHNVLVLKVINEVNNWQAYARFLKDGAAVRNLKIALAPE